jgi:hypothetical protein
MSKTSDENSGESIAEVAVSLLPDLSQMLTPEIIDKPELVITKVLSGILIKKLSDFSNEIKRKSKAGKIRKEFESAESFGEILEFIRTNPEEKRIDAVKKLFFKKIDPATAEGELILLSSLIGVVKQLTMEELLTLKASYESFLKIQDGGAIRLKDGSSIEKSNRDKNLWRKAVAEHLAHGVTSLIASTEKRLEDTKLIVSEHPNDPGSFRSPGNFGLTDYGFKLCEYLSEKKE